MKNIIKIICFLILFILLFICVINIFAKKNNMVLNFYREKRDSIEVISIGSSHMFCTINPAIMWQENGITSYNFGGANQTIPISYYYIKEALKTQKPKLIVLETFMLAIEPSEYVNMDIDNVDSLKFSKNKIDLIKSVIPKDERIYSYFNFLRYHSRWNEINKEDLSYMYDAEKTYIKGFYPIFITNPVEEKDVSRITERKEPLDKNKEYLRKICELVKENNIPLLLMVSPYSVKENEQKVYNAVSDMCNEENIPFLNYNLMYEELELNFNTDFSDSGHVNIYGSQKVTRHLANYIKSNYNIEDRRNDSNYNYWNYDVQQYFNQLNENELVNNT